MWCEWRNWRGKGVMEDGAWMERSTGMYSLYVEFVFL